MKQLDARDGARIDDALNAVRIRPYGVTDQERVRRMSGRLSPASLYTRFFSGTPRLPEHYVGLLERLDHWDRDALVALDGDDIAGIAEYARDKKRPWRADVAVLVTDPWQRRGLGFVLMTCLIELAGRRGVTELDTEPRPHQPGGVPPRPPGLAHRPSDHRRRLRPLPPAAPGTAARSTALPGADPARSGPPSDSAVKPGPLRRDDRTVRTPPGVHGDRSRRPPTRVHASSGGLPTMSRMTQNLLGGPPPTELPENPEARSGPRGRG